MQKNGPVGAGAGEAGGARADRGASHVCAEWRGEEQA